MAPFYVHACMDCGVTWTTDENHPHHGKAEHVAHDVESEAVSIGVTSSSGPGLTLEMSTQPVDPRREERARAEARRREDARRGYVLGRERSKEHGDE